jgi:hypothetical protein
MSDQDDRDMTNTALYLDQEIDKRIAEVILKMFSNGNIKAVPTIKTVGKGPDGEAIEIEGGVDFEGLREIVRYVIKQPDQEQAAHEQRMLDLQNQAMHDMQTAQQQRMAGQWTTSTGMTASGIGQSRGQNPYDPEEKARQSIFDKIMKR